MPDMARDMEKEVEWDVEHYLCESTRDRCWRSGGDSKDAINSNKLSSVQLNK